MRMNWIISVIIVSVLGGCAFKKEEKPALQAVPSIEPQAEPNQFTLAIDWSNDPQGKLGENLKAQRRINRRDGNIFAVDTPVTLPITLPGSLFLGIEVPDELVNQGLNVSNIRAHMYGTSFNLVSEVKELRATPGGKSQLVVILSGLAGVINSDIAVHGVIEAEFYSRDSRLGTFRLPFRTPPSPQDFTVSSMRDWKLAKKGQADKTSHFKLANTELVLVQVLTIPNQQEEVIEVLFSRRPSGRFYQDSTIYALERIFRHDNERHVSWECGHRVDATGNSIVFGDDILLLPMNESLIVEAVNSLKDKNTRDQISAKIQPNSALEIGVYAYGPSAKRWFAEGPIASTSRREQAVQACNWVCRARECQGDHHGGSSNCPCVDWDVQQPRTEVTVGTTAGPVHLDFVTGPVRFLFRYADLSFAQDLETRSEDLLPSQSEVTW